MKKVKLLTDLVIRFETVLAGTVVDLPTNKAKYLISEGRAEAVKVEKEEKKTRKTKEEKGTQNTK